MLVENGELVPRPSAVRIADLLRDLELVFSSHVTSIGRRLITETPAGEPRLETDPSLLLRVLVNMTKNALEATPEGGAVRVWVERCSPAPTRSEEADVEVMRFNVHNEGVISPEIQARIFQRSFSTKARRGRGLGTYSMKLLGERYLSGAVSFVSSPAVGTVFSIELPVPRHSPEHGILRARR